MASRSYTVPTRTPAIVRKSAAELGKPSPSRKRKASTFSEIKTLGNITCVGVFPSVAKQTVSSKAAYAKGDDEVHYGFATVQSPRKKSRKGGSSEEEKRLRVFRKHAPQSYLERLDRVRSQRMFLIDRERISSTDGSHEDEIFDIAGTTGNIYQVKIGKVPSCTCPDAKKGNQCKHIVYVRDFCHVRICVYSCSLKMSSDTCQRLESTRAPSLSTSFLVQRAHHNICPCPLNTSVVTRGCVYRLVA
jgi:hypothetical protein